MRKVLFSTLLGLALAATACKKENKEAAPAAGSAAPAAGSAAPAGEKTAEPTAPAGDTAPAAVAPGEPAPAADPGPRPASVTDADVAMAEKLVGTIEKMGNSLAEAGTDWSVCNCYNSFYVNWTRSDAYWYRYYPYYQTWPAAMAAWG